MPKAYLNGKKNNTSGRKGNNIPLENGIKFRLIRLIISDNLSVNNSDKYRSLP